MGSTLNTKAGPKMHKVFTLSAIALFLTASAFAQQKDFYLRDGDRVLFYGDSITEQRNYTMMIETYVLTRYPNLQIKFTNSGWGGDRVTGGGGGDIDLRLKRDLAPYDPTVVTIMLGMNDGGYKAATEASDKTFFDGYRHIFDVVKKDEPQARVTAIEPSPYDNVTRPPLSSVAGGVLYNQVLVTYGKWISGFAAENHLALADANTGFVRMLETANQIDPETAKGILADHIHPSFGGSLMIGEAVLKAWGARSVVASVTLRADGARVKPETMEHTTVKDLLNENGTIRWTETDDALPLPFAQWQEMWGGGATVGLVIRSSDLTDALNQEPLRITGLKSGVYSIRIDGTAVGNFTNDQLTKGVNLALLKTPMTEQAMSVYQLTTQHNDLRYDRWRHVEVPFASTEPAAPAAMSSMDALETSVVEKQRGVAIPKPHAFEVTPLQ